MARTIDALHKNLPLGSNHIIHDGEYADATARLAEAAFTDNNVDKIYKQLDTGNLWRCVSQSAGVPAWSAFGEGLQYFSEVQDTSAPNDTKTLAYFTPSSADTNVDVAIVPKGNGAFSLNPANLSTSGGDKRGSNAVDLQMSRASTTQVASGNGAFAVGASNTASGESSTAIGVSNVADGKFSFAFGFDGRANGIENKLTHSTFTGYQSGELNLIAPINSTTPTVLLSSTGGSELTSTQLSIPTNSALAYSGLVIAYEDGGANIASWKIEGILYRPTNEASTTLLASTITAISNTPGYTLAITANTTLGCLTLTFTGINTTATKVCANLQTTEVII